MLVSSHMANTIISSLDAYVKLRESCGGASIESNDEHCRTLLTVVQTVMGLLHNTASEACANPAAVVPAANNNGAEHPAQATAAGSPTSVLNFAEDPKYWDMFTGDATYCEPQPKKARTLSSPPVVHQTVTGLLHNTAVVRRARTPTIMDTLTDESVAPPAAAAAPANARLTLTRDCASGEDRQEFWGRSINLDLSLEPHLVNPGPNNKLSELGTFTPHPELTLRIGWIGKESANWSTYKPTAKTFYYRSPDGLVYRSLIDCRRAHYHNEALTQAAMHSALKLNFDSEEDGGDDDIFAEVATIMRD